MESMISALVNAGGLGLLAGAMFFLHWKTVERFEALLQRALGSFEAANQRTVDAYTASNDRAIERFDQISQRTLEAHARELAAERAQCQMHFEAIRGDLKEQRHAIRNVEHSVGIQNALLRAKLNLPPLDQPREEGDK